MTSILSVILFLSQPCQAKAQRTMNGQSILTAEVTALAAMCPGDFGINIEVLNRFKSKAQADKIISDLNNKIRR